MDALRLEVVEEALHIQQALLGPGVSCSAFSGVQFADELFLEQTSDALGNATSEMVPGMFFHSPLLYWNCSLSAVRGDPNLIATVNKGFNKRSPANVTLRWGSVFAGKRFQHHQLVKADALVISFFYRLDSSAGELWDQRATYLARESEIHGRYDVYPSDGKEKGSTLYEVPSHSPSPEARR